MLAALLDGVRRGTKECRRRFRNDRWNCQALTETAGGRRLDFGHVLVKGQSLGTGAQILLNLPDILSPILSHAQASPDLVAVGHRVCGIVAVSEPFPAVVVAIWLEGHTCGMAPGVEPPTVRLGHSGDVHFDLKPISFITWLRNGPIVPKWSYPNQTKNE